MTKQEEIQEGIASQIRAETNGGYLEYWGEFRALLAEDQQKEYFKCIADVILEYLHSQGVVLKVDRELPESPFVKESGDNNGFIVGEDFMLRAGYVAVEPLMGGE